MNRLALLASLALATAACSPPPAPTAPPEEPPAAAEPPAEAPGATNLQLADIPFAAFDPEKPEGVHFHAISGNPKEGAFNAIVRLPPGHSTPLHTHAASYSGVSLTEGLMHASTTEPVEPLPKGSVWHQPAGEPHVDACKSESPCMMMVFFDGAIDMTPAEAPAAEPKVSLHRADQIEWVEVKGGVKMAVIHGNPKEGAFHGLFDFPSGMQTNVHTHSASFVGGLISGTHQRGPAEDQLVTLTDGAVWFEPAGSAHMEKCGPDSHCVMAGAFDGALDTTAVEISATTD